jgi:hypothetical protein
MAIGFVHCDRKPIVKANGSMKLDGSLTAPTPAGARKAHGRGGRAGSSGTPLTRAAAQDRRA